MATQTQLGAHCDLEVQTVSKLLPRFGLPSRGCSVEQFRVAYIRHLREVAAGRKSENEKVDYDLMEERARLSHHQANKTELEEGILRGDLVPVDQMLESWTKKIAVCRAKLLSLPTKSAHIVIAETDVHAVEDLLTDHVHEALEELAGNGLPDEVNRRRNIQNLGDSGSNMEATTKTNSKSVGRPKKKTVSRSKRGTRAVANK